MHEKRGVGRREREKSFYSHFNEDYAFDDNIRLQRETVAINMWI